MFFFASVALLCMLFMVAGGVVHDPVGIGFASVLFCGYFGLIFVASLPFYKRKISLVAFGVAITALDIFWSAILLMMFAKETIEILYIAVPVLMIFIGMNILWLKAVRVNYKDMV